MDHNKVQLSDLLGQLSAMVLRGGPSPEEYGWLGELFHELQTMGAQPVQIAAAYAPTLTPNCLHGLALLKPRGYAGDFEVIDRIYLGKVSDEPSLARHDLFLHSQAAPKAVCNRKTYIKTQLLRLATSARQHPLKVLNIGSGPARDVFEFFSEWPDAPVTVHCIDIDQDALAHASALCSRFGRQITFERNNALRFRPDHHYDMIWSAGLFDYLTDRAFLMLVHRLRPFVTDGGEMIIGNFAPDNPTRPAMELLCEWYLTYRSADHLRQLAAAADVSESATCVDQEPEGVNLFLRIRQGAV